jgi:hypothetical protein
VKTSSAKAKGRSFQQKIAGAFRKAFNLEPDDIHSRAMGSNGEDLMLSPAARRMLPFSFECKKHKTFGVYTHWTQAKANAGKYDPVLVIEANYKEPLVIIGLDTFIKILKETK